MVWSILTACTDSPDAPVKGGAEDADGDGLMAPDDCDDTDPSVGGSEVAYDGIDNDCDPTTADDDLDGDGHVRADDYDDGDASVWWAPDEWEGDLTSGFTDFCEGYGERTIGGNLDLSTATDADVASLSCLTSVGGSLSVEENDELTSLWGLHALTWVGGDVDI